MSRAMKRQAFMPGTCDLGWRMAGRSEMAEARRSGTSGGISAGIAITSLSDQTVTCTCCLCTYRTHIGHHSSRARPWPQGTASKALRICRQGSLHLQCMARQNRQGTSRCHCRGMGLYKSHSVSSRPDRYRKYRPLNMECSCTFPCYCPRCSSCIHPCRPCCNRPNQRTRFCILHLLCMLRHRIS